MKKTYIKPAMNVYQLSATSIIATSLGLNNTVGDEGNFSKRYQGEGSTDRPQIEQKWNEGF